MNCKFLLDEKNMSVYACSKKSGIPYSTLSDIIKGRTPMEGVSFKTAHALADALGISLDALYEKTRVPERLSFETFKSQVRHELKALGDLSFIDEITQSDAITKYWHLEWFYEAFFLLATLDYLCRINNLQAVERYKALREYKLPETVYPMDVRMAAKISPNLDIRRQAVTESIPEFIKYNIVEKEIRDVY